MMIVLDVEGRILRVQSGMGLAPGELGLPHLGGQVDEDAQWIDGGALEPRPALALPATAPAPATLDLSALPAGSSYTARNEAGDAVTADASEPLTLVDPGAYRITAAPPFPWQVVDHRVAVT